MSWLHRHLKKVEKGEDKEDNIRTSDDSLVGENISIKLIFEILNNMSIIKTNIYVQYT